MSILGKIRLRRQAPPAAPETPDSACTMENARNRVAKGARFLDNILGPGWRQVIKAQLGTLSMSSQNDCVLAKLANAGIIPGYQPLGSFRLPYSYAAIFLGLSETRAAELGFAGGNWFFLRMAWIDEACRETVPR